MNHFLMIGSFFTLVVFSLGVRMNLNPRDYKSALGYYTSSSKRNEDTWYEANQYAGRCLMLLSAVLLILLGISELYSVESEIILKAGGVYFVVCVALIYYFTERRLHKIFFRDGKRRPTGM